MADKPSSALFGPSNVFLFRHVRIKRGQQEWNAIAQDFLKNSRTGTQCATHWRMVLKPALLKGVWSPEEDAVIFDCLARGVIDWSEVASFLPKRKAKHCRERWNNHLDPALSNGQWLPAEEAKLMGAVEAHGTNWTQVVRLLPGRSESMAQQHWNSIVLRNSVGTGGGTRRGRRKGEASAGGSGGSGNGSGSGSSGSGGGGVRARAKPSSLPVEPRVHMPGQDLITREEGMSGGGGGGGAGSGSGGGGGVGGGGGRNGAGLPTMGGPEQVVTLTDREKALMDHAFKTGLSAAVGGGGGGVALAPDLAGNRAETLTLSTEEEDIFAPLTAALLKDEDCESYSPVGMAPPSPSASPLKPHKQESGYMSMGDQLGSCWGVVDDDPAMVDLYRSLDNIGESLFNEDTSELLSFDFDSVDKPAQSKGWDTPKEESPFRLAAAKVAATMEHRLSPAKRSSQMHGQDRSLEEACARAAAVAAASATQPAGSASPSADAGAAGAAAAAPQSSLTELAPGPRVKQGFLRQLLSAVTNTDKPSLAPFSTVRGCLSEANAPTSIHERQQRQPQGQEQLHQHSSVPPNTPDDRRQGGGENLAPRRGQPLSVALFAQSSALFAGGGNGKDNAGPTLKHGKVEVKIPPPLSLAPGSGLPLSSLPASRFN